MRRLVRRECRRPELSVGSIAVIAVALIAIACAGEAAGGDLMYSAGPVRLGTGASIIALRAAATGEGKMRLHDYLGRLKAAERIMLVASDLQADQASGVAYDLFLNMPRNTPPGDADRYYVGSINFFNASSPRSEAIENSETKDRRPFMSFDVTDALQRMAKRGNLPESPTLTIIPSGSPVATAHPVVSRIQLIQVSK